MIMEIFCFSKNQSQYPKLLKDLPDAPKEIYASGNLDLLNAPNFAIVGTRKCLTEGKEIAKRFAYELSFAGLNIVSGLAFGIDSSAHEGAMEGKSKTIAVLGSALDNITPHSQEKLAKKILNQGGLIISEYPSGAKVFPANFKNRNRIIAGISMGVLIVEAPFGSGAIITAAFAKKYNRSVFAVPGAIYSKNYEAANDLIKNNLARLVVKPKDILDYLKERSLFNGYDDDDDNDNDDDTSRKDRDNNMTWKIINILKEKPLSIDEIAKKIDIEVAKLLVIISEMEISGKIKDIGNKRYTVEK